MKIKSFEKYKNEAVLFLVMLFVFLFRFPFKERALQLLYGETLITNVGTNFGVVKYLESFDSRLYVICVIFTILIFSVYFIFLLSFIKSQKNKETATYICIGASVLPMSVFSVVSSDNFSLITLCAILVTGSSLLLCEKAKMSVLIPAFLLMSAIISPICVCIAFPMIFYPLRNEIKNNRKQTFHKAAYVMCMLEYAVCTVMIVFKFIDSPYIVKEYIIPCIVTVALSIPVMIPLFIIFREYDKKLILASSLLSIPVLLSSTDTRSFIMCIVGAMIFSVIYLLKKGDNSLKNVTDKLFMWFENHIFLSCCYLIYCCVLSASSLSTSGNFTEILLRYLVL